MLLPIWTWLAGIASWLITAGLDYSSRDSRYKTQVAKEYKAGTKDPTYGAFLKSQKQTVETKAREAIGGADFGTSVRLTSSPTLMVTMLSSLVGFFATPGPKDVSAPLILWLLALCATIVVAGISALDNSTARSLTRWRVVLLSWLVAPIVFGAITRFAPPHVPSPDCPPAAGVSPSR